MHAVSTNHIADILHFNNNSINETVQLVEIIQHSVLVKCNYLIHTDNSYTLFQWIYLNK